MKELVIAPSSLGGKLKIPPSKSQTQRAILFASFGIGTSTIYNPLISPDTEKMILACTNLGAKIHKGINCLTIEGNGNKIQTFQNMIDAGNSGIVMRFVGAMTSLASEYVIFTGDQSLQTLRPMTSLIDGLTQMGAKAFSLYGTGYAPIAVCGPIRPSSIKIEGQDSQPVSALLIASSFLSGTTEIHVKNPGETPWVQLTCDWLRRFGIQIEQDNFSFFKIQGKDALQAFTYTVPADFSSLAFPVISALITKSDLVLENIDFDDTQGDKIILSILQEMGAKITIDKKTNTLSIKGPQQLKGIAIDVNACIDALPILAVLATFSEGKTTLYNGSIARRKESDRIHNTYVELSKMGAKIQEYEDGLIIERSQLVGSSLCSYNDHRIALSLSVAALGAIGTSRLAEYECVKKSYPNFYSDMKSLGAGYTL